MTRRVIHKHDVAKQSLDGIADYLATAASLEVALRFLERADEAFERILHRRASATRKSSGRCSSAAFAPGLFADFGPFGPLSHMTRSTTRRRDSRE